MLLSLDLGTKTGWAMYEPDAMVILSGCENFAGSRFSGGGMRFLKFRQWLFANYSKTKFTHVVYEEVRRHRGTDAAHIYGGLQGVLTGFCEEYEIPYEGVPVGTIKKFWAGKGNANKDEMIAAGHKRGFARVSDDNEMDALALLHLQLDKMTHLQGVDCELEKLLN